MDEGKRTLIETTAIYLRPGDWWRGRGSGVLIHETELTDDGLLCVVGTIMTGRDRGFKGSWVLAFDTILEVER